MKNQLARTKRLNGRITKRVIELHEKGYSMDFQSISKHYYLCLQDSFGFAIDDLVIVVIDQIFDRFSKTYKYIHTVESTTGCKGVLLSDNICATAWNQHVLNQP
jgi:hypothetical protein